MTFSQVLLGGVLAMLGYFAVRFFTMAKKIQRLENDLHAQRLEKAVNEVVYEALKKSLDDLIVDANKRYGGGDTPPESQ